MVMSNWHSSGRGLRVVCFNTQLCWTACDRILTNQSHVSQLAIRQYHLHDNTITCPNLQCPCDKWFLLTALQQPKQYPLVQLARSLWYMYIAGDCSPRMQQSGQATITARRHGWIASVSYGLCSLSDSLPDVAYTGVLAWSIELIAHHQSLIKCCLIDISHLMHVVSSLDLRRSPLSSWLISQDLVYFELQFELTKWL